MWVAAAPIEQPLLKHAGPEVSSAKQGQMSTYHLIAWWAAKGAALRVSPCYLQHTRRCVIFEERDVQCVCFACG